MTPTEEASEAQVKVSRFQVAVAALMVVAGALLYPSLPARIPQHWDVYGKIDRWADKSLLSVFFPVLIVAVMIVLYWALPRLDPMKKSYARFRHSYALMIDMVVGFMAFIYAITLYAAFHPAVPVDVAISVGVGLLLAALGNQMSKVKRNFFVGIKTPWTLASEKVWTRTHRLSARLWVWGGLAAALCGFLPAPFNFVLFITIAMALGAGSVLLSYLIYRDLERRGELEPIGPALQSGAR
jgi:uncharacterized membrane protein